MQIIYSVFNTHFEYVLTDTIIIHNFCRMAEYLIHCHTEAVSSN